MNVKRYDIWTSIFTIVAIVCTIVATHFPNNQGLFAFVTVVAILMAIASMTLYFCHHYFNGNKKEDHEQS